MRRAARRLATAAAAAAAAAHAAPPSARSAAAKAGRSVLQLDAGAHYGGAWATLRLDELLAELAAASAGAPAAGFAAPLAAPRAWRAPGAGLGAPRCFAADLAPRALYGGGGGVRLLLGAGAHHHAEFKLVRGAWLSEGGALLAVPASRAEVFRDASLAPLQKRALTRLLRACAEALAGRGALAEQLDARPLEGVLAAAGLDAPLRRRFAHGVLLLPRPAAEEPAAAALPALRLYAESAGRYGPGTGPLLASMHGVGELPQAFCRAAAVAGAVQALRCPVEALVIEGGRCTGVRLAGGHVVPCARVAGGAAALRALAAPALAALPLAPAPVLRCVAVLDAPLARGEAQSFVALPPSKAPGVARTVWGLALGAGTAAAPPGRWLLQLWADGAGAAPGASLLPALRALADADALEEVDVAAAARELASDAAPPAEAAEPPAGDDAARRPRVLFAACFTACGERADGAPGPEWPPNVVLCAGAGGEAVADAATDDARRCYAALFPEAASAAFPLDPPEEEARGEADSDDEALEALRAALGEAPAPAGAD